MRMLSVFEKGERLRHIGHLDLMRAMQRALRRSGLPVSYSKGFNPHILHTFASALSTGAWGRREIMDTTFDEEITPEEFMTAMNAALPVDLQMISARVLEERHPALMAQVAAADYTIRLMDAGAAERLAACREDFLAQATIITPRKTKSGVKDCDVKPLIEGLTVEGEFLRARLTLTADASCKPDMLLRAMCDFSGCEVPRCLIRRDALYGLDAAGTLKPLETL